MSVKQGQITSRKGRKVEYFPRVRAAREALRERALEILDMYLKTVKEAQEEGDRELVVTSLQYLMDHMPDDAGERMIDASVDKPKQVEQGRAPAIQIGIALGGIAKPKELPAITVESVDE